MSSPNPRRRLVLIALLLAVVIGLPLLATGGSPWVEEKRAASGEQVAAAKELAQTARSSRETGKPVSLTLDNPDLAALSAMASQGAAPARVDARIEDGVLTVTGSRPLLWRWLNIRAQTSGTSKGLPEWRIVTQHALRGGLIPVIAFLGPAFAGLLAGSFVVETIFQIPGLGRFYVQAAFNRDYTMILGTTVFLSSLIVFFNLVSDIIAAWLNPRLRHQFQGGGS